MRPIWATKPKTATPGFPGGYFFAWVLVGVASSLTSLAEGFEDKCAPGSIRGRSSAGTTTMKICEQLTRVLPQVGTTPSALAKRVGVSNMSVHNWLSGRNRPGPRHRAAVERALDVKLDWTEGEGAIGVQSLSPHFLEEIELLPRLSAQSRKLVLLLLRELANPRQKELEQKPAGGRVRSLLGTDVLE
jgi:transcriptional regulator with XRE-family HTH domain